MIIDWATHCNQIMATNHLKREDPSDNKIYFKQEVAYIRYLRHLGKSYDECFNHWLLINNGVASKFSGEKDQLSVQFHRAYVRSQTKAYSFIDRASALKPVCIYKSEVKKINSLKCSKWVKEYILILLVYHKFCHQTSDLVEYSTTFVNWALRNVDYGDYKFRSYRDARNIIAATIREAPFRVVKFTPISKKEKYTTYSVPFSTNDGDAAMLLFDIDSIKDAFCLLRDDVATCEQCGEQFPINSKTKRTLCTKCYKRYRRKYKTDKDREYYHRDKK